MIDRDDRGRVVAIRRRQLVDRWAQDYSFEKSNRARAYLDPMGVPSLVVGLRTAQGLAVTGGLGARSYLAEGVEPVIPNVSLWVYALDPGALVRSRGLVEVERRQANVLLAQPRDPMLVTQAPGSMYDIRVVELPRVLVDLYSAPGRETALADQLVDQLAQSDPSWAPS